VTSREQMLGRIRKALGRSPDVSGKELPRTDLLSPLAPVMPTIAAEDLAPKFEAELVKVGGRHHRAADRSDLCGILTEIAMESRAVVLSRNPLLVDLKVANQLTGRGLRLATWPGDSVEGPEQATVNDFRESCFAADLGITGVDFALAETGSLVLTSMTEGSQLASLTPPIHVALYRRSQLVASLEEVLERLPLPRMPDAGLLGRSVVIVTGTSRTADIEQILIRGVHGPREVHAILIEDNCLSSC